MWAYVDVVIPELCTGVLEEALGSLQSCQYGSRRENEILELGQQMRGPAILALIVSRQFLLYVDVLARTNSGVYDSLGSDVPSGRIDNDPPIRATFRRRENRSLSLKVQLPCRQQFR